MSIMTLLLFLLILSVLVFAHELGHFVMAKRAGMKVDEFGFGFPPRLFGVKRGDTLYSVNAIPLGGFVRIKGESGEHRADADSFSSKSLWARFLVLIAGVTMNVLVAGLLYGIGFTVGMPTVLDGGLPASAEVADRALEVMAVTPESPAAVGGIVSGDTIVSLDGHLFETADAARSYIFEHGDQGIEVVVQKTDGTFVTYPLTAADIPETQIHGLGVGIVTTGIVSYPTHLALVYGFGGAFTATRDVAWAFVDLIKTVVVEQKVNVELSGPVGIAVMTGEVAKLGFVYVLQFAAILSVNLAVINILPFPALDGGRLLFLFIEAVRRRAVDEKTEAVVHNIGFALLMALVVLVTYRDFVKFGGQMWGAIRGFVGM
jgi:regulator of sigma E protease